MSCLPRISLPTLRAELVINGSSDVLAIHPISLCSPEMPPRTSGHRPPRPAPAGRHRGIATGTGRMHAPLSPGRQVTRSPATRYRPRSRARLPTAADGALRPMDHWSKPIVACAGSVLARTFRYGAARSGTRRHQPSVTAPPEPHRKGYRCPTDDRGFLPAILPTVHMHGGSRAAFPQAATQGRRQPARGARPIRRNGRSLLIS
jgi:hypothetical protein